MRMEHSKRVHFQYDNYFYFLLAPIIYWRMILIFWVDGLKIYIMNFQSIKSEHPYHSSINNESWKKIKIIIVLKMNSLAVFHSHWRCVAAPNLLLFLIGSTDQLDVFCPTVSRVFDFWLNDSLRPRGKQKLAKLLCFFRVWDQNLVAARGDYDVLVVLQCVLWCVMRCDAMHSI